MSVVVWRGIKFFVNLVRCKVRGIAKIPVQRIAEVVRARFYHGAKFRLLLIFAPVVILLGSAFPKPCWWATAANFLLAPFGNSAICGVVGSKRKFEKVLRPTLNNRSPRWVRWRAVIKQLEIFRKNFYCLPCKSASETWVRWKRNNQTFTLSRRNPSKKICYFSGIAKNRGQKRLENGGI